MGNGKETLQSITIIISVNTIMFNIKRIILRYRNESSKSPRKLNQFIVS